jgi:hypothetical protein
MFIADDPLLALILRFILDPDRSEVENEEFLRVQIKTLRKHLLQFPAEEQEARAMDWVVQHAAGYRRCWQRRAVSRQTWSLRCEDCPLRDRIDTAEHCEIHEQWLYLLRRYLTGELRSREYVQHALALLQGQKDALARRRVVAERTPEKRKGSPKPNAKKKLKTKQKRPEEPGKGGWETASTVKSKKKRAKLKGKHKGKGKGKENAKQSSLP